MTSEREVSMFNGWPMLVVNLGVMAGSVFFLLGSHPAMGFCGLILGIILLTGHFSLQPNESRVMVLFGSYHGTVKRSGFYWANPFYSKGWAVQTQRTGSHEPVSLSGKSKLKISLRLRTLNVPQIKVNDQRGNPIEIGAVVVWRIENTAQAAFDVDDFEEFVRLQSETGLRHLATAYPYDHGEGGEGSEIALRTNVNEISLSLKAELQERVRQAGVIIEETRLTHLAYAPEIAGVMLRRQQAEAIIAARQKIVHGAVSMVQMALDDLAKKNVLELDEERKAAMVSNLLVVLCAEREAQPVVNAGTLYP